MCHPFTNYVTDPLSDVMAFPTPKAVAKHTSANLFRYPVTRLVTNPFLDFCIWCFSLGNRKKYSWCKNDVSYIFLEF